MTIRTLLLENTLTGLHGGAVGRRCPYKVSLERVLSLLFERSGARMETPSQVVYWVNTTGLSLPNRRLLEQRSSRGFAPWTCRIRANRFTFASKTCRLEAALFMGRSNVHFFKTVRSALYHILQKVFCNGFYVHLDRTNLRAEMEQGAL